MCAGSGGHHEWSDPAGLCGPWAWHGNCSPRRPLLWLGHGLTPPAPRCVGPQSTSHPRSSCVRDTASRWTGGPWASFSTSSWWAVCPSLETLREELFGQVISGACIRGGQAGHETREGPRPRGPKSEPYPTPCSADDILWPEGEEALPTDAQHLISASCRLIP